MIRAAARALLKQCHPDKNPDRPEWADTQTRLITESLEALTDPACRASINASAAHASDGGVAPHEPSGSPEERLFHQGYVGQLHGRYPEAIQAYEQCLIVNPRNAAAHYNIGCIYEAQGLGQKAQRAYHAAHVVSPGYRDALTRSAALTRARFSPSSARSPLRVVHA